MSAGIYVRSARPDGMNLARQRQQCEDYAHEHGLVISGVYSDTGRSRYGMDTLLHEAAEQGITDLIVADLDRLSGEPTASARTRAAIEAVGITLHVPRDRAILENAFLRSLIRNIAAAERAAEHDDATR